MASGGGSLNEALGLLGVLLGLVAGYLIATRLKRAKFFAAAEYWVYLPGEKLPSQDQIMSRVIGANPYGAAGKSPIGTQEGILFSDIRLHIGLVLRSKNPHVFRPDLFEDHVVPTQEHLEALSDSLSFAKVRYLSEEPLPDKRHLQLLTHLADAIAELGSGKVIFDATAERLLSRNELSEQLEADADGTRPDLHLRTIFKRLASGGVVQTRGLMKIGVKELTTREIESDEALLAQSVLEEAAREIWNQGHLPASLEVSAYEDRFKVEVLPSRDKYATVRLLRMQTA